MVKPHDFVVSLEHVDRDDTLYVGGKGANLGEMIGADFPVPPGFVITSKAYFEFLKSNSLETKIQHLLEGVNYQVADSLEQTSKNIKRLIVSSPIPEEITQKIFDLYEKIGLKTPVAIRSSATSEDSKEASFAGQNETFLDVIGEAAVIDSVRRAWASFFDARSIFYRHEKKVSQVGAGIALVVQKMVESDASGVTFTVDPVTGDRSKIIIESILGLGEYIVQGKVTPDHYEVDKKSFQILKKNISEQKIMLVKKGDRDVEIQTGAKGKLQKITDHEILILAKLAAKIEKHYFFPQDIEWAREKKDLYIVQTRPITTIGKKNQKEAPKDEVKGGYVHAGRPILIGNPASPGVGIGRVIKIEEKKDFHKLKMGDVLVARLTNPDYVPIMKKSAAIITQEGGRTSHAAIVAREFGIPAVVGTPRALSTLRDEDIVTVNGKTGEIFKGKVLIKTAVQSDQFSNIKTATKLYVNMSEPELAEQNAAKNVDGVGLLRAEFMIAQIGIHPKKLIHDGKSHMFVDKLAEGIGEICRAFYPRPVLYRATDFKTNEYRKLIGGSHFEPVEANPMIGYRGAFRFLHDPQVFKLELAAIRKVRDKMGFNNLNLMLPFVRTVKELQEVKQIISHEGLKRSPTFKLYMMAEVPSNVILIEEFIKTGIDGVSVGSNDLTMLILGVDRDSQEVASEYDERNQAVLWCLERLIRACKKEGIPISICGQAPSVYPSLVEDLVSWGIDSVSVSIDAVDNTRRIIYHAEERVINKKKYA